MNRLSFKNLLILIPLLFSGFLSILIFYLLWIKVGLAPEYAATIIQLTPTFITVSAIISGSILLIVAISYYFSKYSPSINRDAAGGIVQKFNDFRAIVEILVNSQMWIPGLKEYVDSEFAGLTFFEVKEFYKGESKLAIEFLQENNKYGETENLYLELKALLMTQPKERKLPETISYPNSYPEAITSKWLEHKSGSGLWYFFGYKYSDFKTALNLNSVFERYQEKIMKLAQRIDPELFEDSSFNEIFLSKLGDYISGTVIPVLYEQSKNTVNKISSLKGLMTPLFSGLMLFGVLLPLLSLLLSFPIWTLMISFSIVCGFLFFVAAAIYRFIQN